MFSLKQSLPTRHIDVLTMSPIHRYYNKGRLKGYQGGFTLVELVIVTVIIAIIGGILYQIIIMSADAWVFLSSRQELVQDGRVAMLRMVREIREAETILAAGKMGLRFRNPRGEEIVYRWLGTTLERGVEEAFYPLASNVQNFEFEYFSMDGIICRIVIKLDLQKGKESFRLESQVHPRNF